MELTYLGVMDAKMSKIRTRFAPSPSGYLHIGGVRTALYNWLYAKKHGGQFILRIDDTDQQRNMDEALRPILQGFKWLGMTWDEGPEVGGPHVPYFQSQRTARYAEVAEKLRSGGQAYRGTMEKLAEGSSIYTDDGGAIRLYMGREGKIGFDDLVRGRVEWNRKDVKDPVIVRSDGTALYNLATVVDDHDMEISHIFRAEEHLSNTPIQLRIYEALEWAPPQFGHLSFVCAPGSKKKLSKRDMERFLTPDILGRLAALGYSEEQAKAGLNPATLAYYEVMGYLPAGVMNYLALLGWSKDGTTEFFTVDDLIKEFNVDGLHSAPASFDPKKFIHINSEHMSRADKDSLLYGYAMALHAAGAIDEFSSAFDKINKVATACGDRLKICSDIVGYGASFFLRDPVFDEKAYEKRLSDENIRKMVLQFATELGVIDAPQDFEKAFHEFCAANGAKESDMVHAIRIAITGQPIGPGLFDCMAILGVEETRRRVVAALNRRQK